MTGLNLTAVEETLTRTAVSSDPEDSDTVSGGGPTEPGPVERGGETNALEQTGPTEFPHFAQATVAEFGTSPTSDQSQVGLASNWLDTRGLRLAGYVALTGFGIGSILLAVGQAAGLIVYSATAGLIGLSLLAFQMENGIEVVRSRYLLGISLGLLGVALSGLAAWMLAT